MKTRTKEGILIPGKPSPVNRTLEDIRNKIEKLGITEKDAGDAIKWARKRIKRVV